eukprot:SAG11_NODE_8707_length_985_cov_1.067720_1_plen_69_part_10
MYMYIRVLYLGTTMYTTPVNKSVYLRRSHNYSCNYTAVVHVGTAVMHLPRSNHTSVMPVLNLVLVLILY